MRPWSALALALVGCGELSEPVRDDAGDAGVAAPVCTQPSPELLLTSAYRSISQIESDGSSVYWISYDDDLPSPGELWRAPREAVDAGAATYVGPCERFVLDGDFAYCLSLSQVLALPIDGGAFTTLATSPAAPLGRIVADAHDLYFASCTSTCAESATVWRVSEDGGIPTALATGPYAQVYAAAAEKVFWSAERNTDDGSPSTAINATTGDGTTTTLATLPIHAGDVVLQGDALYVEGYDPNDPSTEPSAVWRVPTDGSGATLFASDIQPGPLAVDDSALYVTSLPSEQFIALRLDGGPAHAIDIDTRVDVSAVDDTYLFVATNTSDEGALYRACK